MRHYKVERLDHQNKVVEVRLIKAPTQSSALNHAAHTMFRITRPNEDELVELLLQGRKPEEVEIRKVGRPKRSAA